MMKKFITNLVLVCIMLLGFTSVSSAANWQWITSTDDTTYSFDTTSIIDKSYKISNTEYGNLVYSVWTKTEYTDAKGEELAAQLNYNKPIKYSLSEREFDHKNKATRTNAMHIYTKDGTRIESVPSYILGSSFESIIPDSIGEVIFQVTFKEFKAQYGKK